jgi:hypothetical protein
MVVLAQLHTERPESWLFLSLNRCWVGPTRVILRDLENEPKLWLRIALVCTSILFSKSLRPRICYSYKLSESTFRRNIPRECLKAINAH